MDIYMWNDLMDAGFTRNRDVREWMANRIQLTRTSNKKQAAELILRNAELWKRIHTKAKRVRAALKGHKTRKERIQSRSN